MSKKQTKKESFKDKYTLVTEKNRKHILISGRILYVYEEYPKEFKLCGEFEVRPRLKKGYFIRNGEKIFITEDENREEYVNGFRAVVDTLIKEQRLFVDVKDKLIKYEER